MSKSLVGKQEIKAYTRRSWQTIQAWIDTENFPARKIGGVWESNKDLVDEWRRNNILKRPLVGVGWE